MPLEQWHRWVFRTKVLIMLMLERLRQMNKKKDATEFSSQKSSCILSWSYTENIDSWLVYFHNLNLVEGGALQWRWQLLVCLNVMERNSFNCLHLFIEEKESIHGNSRKGQMSFGYMWSVEGSSHHKYLGKILRDAMVIYSCGNSFLGRTWMTSTPSSYSPSNKPKYISITFRPGKPVCLLSWCIDPK